MNPRKDRLLFTGLFTILVLVASPLLWAQAPARFAYVVNFGGPPEGPGVSAYTVNPFTGALTEITGSPFPLAAASEAPAALTVDPTGRFLYVAGAERGIAAYTINAETGGLTEISGSPFPAGDPRSVAVDPTGRFLYAPNSNANNISAYTIDSETGELTRVPGSPFPAPPNPWSVTVDPTGRFAYVVSFRLGGQPGLISGFSINAETGALTSVPGSPFAAGIHPYAVTVEPGGRFVYVLNFVGLSDLGSVSAYSVNLATGALTQVLGSPFRTGWRALSLAVEPTGRFLYVAHAGSAPGAGAVSAYTVNPESGALMPLPGSPFPADRWLTSITVEPAANVVYVVGFGPGPIARSGVSMYTLDTTTGALVAPPFPAGQASTSIVTTAGPKRARRPQ